MSPKSKFQVVSLDEVPQEDVVIGQKLPTVLVVDDEAVIADTLSIILIKSGFSTVTAYDGATALELAKRVRPRLLISDVVMPDMTGIELAIEVTRIDPDCKVLLFSGQAATVGLLEEARKSGHNFTTLIKPVHPADMLRRVSESLTMGGEYSGGGPRELGSGGYTYMEGT
jgi:DNA-binding NtrC family response regulator